MKKPFKPATIFSCVGAMAGVRAGEEGYPKAWVTLASLTTVRALAG
jgi:hypothetical protein